MDTLLFGLNIVAVLGTIGFGLFGWLRPVSTMELLGLASTDATGLGKSEVRAASGALWVVVGIAALVLWSPLALAMTGMVWAGAGLGRLTAILVDRATAPMVLLFFAVEATFAAVLLGINLPGLL